MDYRTSIRALFEAVLLEGKTTGGDPEATGKRVGAFLNRPGNNTFKNFKRSNEILDKMKKRKSGKASNPNVTKPYFSGMRQGLGYQRDDASTNHFRDNIRAIFEAILNEEGFEYQKPGQLSKSKRNQAEYQDRRERELSGRIVTRGGGNLLDKDIMHRQSARALRAIKDKSPHSVDRYGNPRSVPDTHTFMNLAHVKADREAKRKAREERLARKAEAAAKAAAKAQQQNSSTDHSRDNLRAIFEAIVNESRKGYMARLGKKPTKNPTTGKTEYMSDKELGKAVKTKDQGSDWSGQEPKFTNKEALKALGSTQRKFFDPKKKK